MQGQTNIKQYKSQIIVYLVTAFVQTLLMTIFLIYYHEPVSLMIVLIAVILVVWLIATLKIVSSLMAIKRIKNNYEE